jgi:ubiquinone/menaquinone biosynthesis C-methylase UbiE
VISDALGESTISWLEAAGLGPGMRCLDLGCGGGDVTLAIARLVGSTGSVLGIDMDAVKIELAGREAADEQLSNVEWRTGDAAVLDAAAEFDLVYARLLLTHLPDPVAVLEQHRVTNLAAAPTVYRALRASFTGWRAT